MTRSANRLLSKNLNISRLAVFAVANFIGLAIVMSAIHFYFDISATINSTADENSDYIVISKQIGAFGQVDAEGFSPQQVDSIASEPWVSDIGAFEPSKGDVTATVMLPGSPLSTSLFFESVPDRFLDVKPSSFTYDKGDTTVPVILPKEYLSLYNFGYASARNLPPMSEAMLGMVPLKLTITTDGQPKVFKGRIVGFSSRINTIAVPASFIKVINGSDSQTPTRLIVKINPAQRHLIQPYLDSHKLETSSSAIKSHTDYILRIITTTVVVIGLVICALSILILILSIFLMLEKNRDKTRLLLQLGYSPRSIENYYRSLVLIINAAVFIIATLLLILADRFILHHVNPYLTIGHTSLTLPIATSLIITLISTAINFISINRAVKK